MRGSIIKLLRAFSAAGGGDEAGLRAWWKALARPDREHAGKEMRRRLNQFRAERGASAK